MIAPDILPALILKKIAGSQGQVNRIVRQVTGKAYKYVVPTAGHTPHKEAKEMVLKRSVAFIHEVVAKRVI